MASKDLGRLFEIMTSVCPPHNIQWRQAACKVNIFPLATFNRCHNDQALTTVGNRALNEATLNYLCQNACVTRCVQALQNASIFTFPEVAGIFEVVSALIKVSAGFSFALVDEFRNAGGFNAVTSVAFQHEMTHPFVLLSVA